MTTSTHADAYWSALVAAPAARRGPLRLILARRAADVEGWEPCPAACPECRGSALCPDCGGSPGGWHPLGGRCALCESRPGVCYLCAADPGECPDCYGAGVRPVGVAVTPELPL